jgi:hypothetical protein
MKTLDAQWSEFAGQVIPVDALPVQRIEMKRAFYGGAHVILSMMFHAVGPESVSEEEGIKLLETWHRECEVFVASQR